MNLRIMTFNLRVDVAVDQHLRFTHRLPHIKDFLASTHVDVLATQEGTLAMCRALDLVNYHMIAHEREPLGETTALFIDKKFPLLDSGHFWLSDTPDRESKHQDAGCKRIITYAKIAFNHAPLTLVNVHFDHVSQTARNEGVKVLLNQIKDFLAGPLVLLGDMNALYTESLHAMLNEAGLSHGYNKKQLEYTTFHGYTNAMKGSPIDFIYATNHFVFETLEILNDTRYPLYLSDHYPVLATLKKRT